MKKNKGYTLVEMLVVIAIMAILSGLAAVSLGLIYKAKVRDGMQVFNSQLSNTWLRTKSTASKSDSMYAEMSWVADGFEYKIYNDGTEKCSATIKKWTNSVAWGNNLKVSYTPSDPSQLETGYGDSVKKWYIRFDKSTGSVIRGAGTYEFTGNDGNVVGTIYLDATTGNHYSVIKDSSSSAYSVSKK